MQESDMQESDMQESDMQEPDSAQHLSLPNESCWRLCLHMSLRMRHYILNRRNRYEYKTGSNRIFAFG